MQSEIELENIGNKSEEKDEESELTQPTTDVTEEEKEEPNFSQPSYKPSILFPQRLSKEKIEEKIKRFVEMLRNIHINISSTEALSQISFYVKFHMEILSSNSKLDDNITITLTKES